MLQTTVSKIQERSPLKYNLARKLVSMDPRLMVSNPDNATKMFQQVLQILIENKWKTAEEADTVLAQYRKFVFDAKSITQQSFLLLRVEKIDWLFLVRNSTDVSRISGFVANNAATSYIITWSGYS